MAGEKDQLILADWVAPRTCILCAHCYFDAGEPYRSELTPGSEWSCGCLKGYFRMSGPDVSNKEYADNMLRAEKCPGFAIARLIVEGDRAGRLEVEATRIRTRNLLEEKRDQLWARLVFSVRNVLGFLTVIGREKTPVAIDLAHSLAAAQDFASPQSERGGAGASEADSSRC